MKNTLVASPKSSKILKNQPKMQATHELGKRKASKIDFGRFLMFWGVPGRAENHQKSKKGLPKIDRKKGRKKGGEATRFRCGSAEGAAQGIQDSCSGRLLPSPETGSKARQHSRRSAADLPGYAIFRRHLRSLGTENRDYGSNSARNRE